jgi:hypothetical protein
MADLSAKFTALESQLTTEHTATQTSLAAVQASLDAINTLLDTLDINGAVNTRALLAAISANSPCVDCGSTSLVVPPTSVGDTPQTEELCKRVQAFLHAMGNVYTALDVMSAFGVGFSLSVLTSAYNEVITALANGDTTPTPSFPEAVQIVGDGISYIASNLLVGHTLVGLFAPLYFDLLKPMFRAGSASAAQTVYNGVIDGSGDTTFEIRLLEHAAYNALYSYYFDPTSTPNLTGYDGTLCFDPISGITECTDYVGAPTVLFGQNFHVVQVAPFGSLVGWDNAGDIFGFTFQLVAPTAAGVVCNVYSVVAGPVENVFFTMTMGDAPRVIIGHTSEFSIRNGTGTSDDHPYTLRICPPA